MRISARVNKGQHSRWATDTLYGYDNEIPEDFVQPRKRRRTIEDDEVRCTPCGTTKENYDDTNDVGGTFVLCEECSTWQHAKCMGFVDTIPERYVCDVCQRDLDVKYKSEPHRASTAKAFFSYFKNCFPADHKFEGDDTAELVARKWACEIESVLYNEYPKSKYGAESRRILFLLKKNFMPDLIAGTITFAEVVKKTPEEINASIAAVKSKLKEDIKNHIIGPSHLEALRQEQREAEAAEAAAADLVVRSVDHRQFASSEAEIATPKIIRPASPSSNPTFINHGDDDDDDHDDDDHNDDDDAQAANSESSSSSSLESVQTPSTVATEPPSIAPSISKPLWHGEITFPDFASFNGQGMFYSSSLGGGSPSATSVAKEIMRHSGYLVEGRLDRRKADSYLDVVMQSRDLYAVKITGSDSGYQKLYDYLLYKNKVGVLNNRPQNVKDSYLMAIDFRDSNAPAWVQHLKQADEIGMFAVFVVRREPREEKFEELLKQL